MEEHDRPNGVRVTSWVCPEDRECWLCLEAGADNGMLELVQVRFPDRDNPWSVRLAVAVVRAICKYQLAVEV